MIEPVEDCGHECCDERGNPFHSHFLNPDDCPSCAAHLAVQAELWAEVEALAARVKQLTRDPEEQQAR